MTKNGNYQFDLLIALTCSRVKETQGQFLNYWDEKEERKEANNDFERIHTKERQNRISGGSLSIVLRACAFPR